MNASELANKIFDKVNKAGAEADLLVNESSSLSLKANDGALSEHAVKSSLIVGLRVVKDSHVGMSSSEATDEESIDFLVEQALNNARHSEKKPEEIIHKQIGEIQSDLQHLCPEDTSSIDEKIDFILELEQNLLARDKIRNVPYNALVDATHTQQVFTSRGRIARQKMRETMSYAYPLAEKDDVTAMEAGVMVDRRFEMLNVAQIADEAYQNSIAMLDGKPIPTKHYDVIFDADTQHSLFQSFSLIWSGKAAKDGINPWRDHLGEFKLDKRITIVDDPLLNSLGFSAFDAEGIECQATTLVAKGQLNTFAHNTATAIYFDVKTTANAARGAKSSLGVGLHQLTLLAGPDSNTTLLSGDYIEITGLDGLHSGTHPVSGDFSCGASGYLCKDGQRIQAIRGITVAGNFYQMLNKIVAVGNQPRWNDSKRSLMAAIRFADIAVSGS